MAANVGLNAKLDLGNKMHKENSVWVNGMQGMWMKKKGYFAYKIILHIKGRDLCSAK